MTNKRKSFEVSSYFFIKLLQNIKINAIIFMENYNYRRNGMFLFGKKKKKDEPIEDEELEITEAEDTDDTELDLDEDVEIMSEEEILDQLDDDDGEDSSDGEEPEELPDVTKTPVSFDELADIVSSKKVGVVQYMKKSTGEVFGLRDYHFRYARLLGAVSMGSEIAPVEYAKITLAGEVLEDINAFYILPYLNDAEMMDTVMSFCDDQYGVNGKKYVKNPDKFVKFLKEYDCLDEWQLYVKAAVVEKLSAYCEKNEIVFSEDSNDE